MTVAATECAKGLAIRLMLNGSWREVVVDPAARLSDLLRDHFGLTGVKVGCNAGDCGACTILFDGVQACACLIPAAQADDKVVVTIEGLTSHGHLSRVQQAFERHGAAQCGICTPGMILAATEILAAKERPSVAEVHAALAGVLCRCTGYTKIVEAVLDAARVGLPEAPPSGQAVGARALRVDGRARTLGEARYGADVIPADALWLRAVRSPHASARFSVGDLDGFLAAHPGIIRVLTAADVPGSNRLGCFPEIRDQPVLAEGLVRYRGEAVLALVGDKTAVEAVRDEDLPIAWEPLPAIESIEAAVAAVGEPVHGERPDNLLIEARLESGDADAAFLGAAHVVEGSFETAFVEHAYIEPEAGYARRVGDRIEVHATTQSPYFDRGEIAVVMGLAPEAVRIVPTACGGGFGGKIDQSVQPLTAIAAWYLDRPVACVYSRPESMAASTKRHPARLHVRMASDSAGESLALDFDADFNTGAYSSWGPAVVGRVPVHAGGPYRFADFRARSRAYYTNGPPAGAFRGFGVPQSAIAQEALIDELAGRLGVDPLEFRLSHALRRGDVLATGQRLKASVGLIDCLEALRPHWQAALDEVEADNAAGPVRLGAGIAAAWYGIGNTAASNPSTMRIGLRANGRLTLYSGAVDIGQGVDTVLTQIAADVLGVEMGLIDLVRGDTDLTEDAGKTSASRQTYISGRAVQLACEDLAAGIRRLANVGETEKMAIGDGEILLGEVGSGHRIALARLLAGERGDVLLGQGSFDPPTTLLGAASCRIPYATYAFSAQVALVAVDLELGTTQVRRIVAAVDVGRAINPVLVEGQVEGGIAQGLGMALMEEYLPGVTENLHDYLIPTVGDMPEIEVILIEDPEPTGPFGAKGVGEPSLLPTAPAILAGIRQATGAAINVAPATPDRVRRAILEARAAR